jgi:hypothetical protein
VLGEGCREDFKKLVLTDLKARLSKPQKWYGLNTVLYEDNAINFQITDTVDLMFQCNTGKLERFKKKRKDRWLEIGCIE